MKKGFKNLAVVALSVFGLVGCGASNTSTNTSSAGYGFKAGLITLHDSNSTYDKNFIDSFKAAAEAKGVTAKVTSGINEDAGVTTEADNMVDDGCKFVFADSFGHETFLLDSAKKHSDVQFAHATGTYAHTEKRANFHNSFASIYEGRYLAGVAAGMKLQEMITNNSLPATAKKDGDNYIVGYVGAYTYAEVISGYTSWFLGVKSVVSNVVMDVQFTGSWYDETGEKSAAETLISKGAAVMSQHADSWGAPTACETAGVPDISYNGSTASKCPNTYIISSRVDWQPYFEHAFDCVKNGTAIEDDYVGGLGSDLYTGTGSVKLTEPGTNAAAGTKAKLEEVAGKLRDGSLKVFDTSKFTVTVVKEGESTKNVNATVDADGHLTSYKADVDTDAAYTADTEVIKTSGSTSYFAESEYRSAPYFDVQIDGINLLNAKF